MDFCEPRYATRRRPERETHGKRVAKVAAMLGTPLMAWQQMVVDVGLEMVESDRGLVPAYREIIVTVPRQSGKDVDASTPILTTSGWKTMGTVVVGDEVYGPDGLPTEVTFCSETFTDHPCYEVEFTDGSVYIAGEDHVWWVYDLHGHDPVAWANRLPGIRPKGAWRGRTTREIAESRWGHLRPNGRNEYRYRVRCDAVVQTPERILPVDPYIFGYWLGDGTSHFSDITAGEVDRAHVENSIVAAGYKVVSSKNTRDRVWRIRFNIDEDHGDGFESRAARLDVRDNKHIPEIYQTASVEQRKALLAGLLDSDGCIGGQSKTPRIEFCSTNKRLAYDVLRLARSLGIRTEINENDAKLYGRFTSTRYRICWTPTFNPFRLQRKADKFREPASARQELMSIVGVREVPTVPTRCIQVAHPDHVFLIGETFTPTHNTTVVLSIELDRCLAWGKPQRVAYTAQTGLDARKKVLEDQLPLIERSELLGPAVKNVRRAQGSEGIDFQGGSALDVLASTESAGHGRTLDLGVIDEAFKDTDDRREGAMLPAMVTRADAQLLVVSTMGTDASTYLNRKCTAGRDFSLSGRDDAEIAYFEWSADPEADIDDPATWRSCMPAFGVTISERAVRHARETMTEGEFRRAYLNLHTASAERVIPADVWTRVAGDVTPDGSIVIGIDCNPERTQGSIAVADLEGRCELVEHESGTAWLVKQAVDKAKRWNAPVAYDPTGPAGVFGDDIAQHGIKTVPISGRDMAHACSLFFDAVIDTKIHVRPHGSLNAAVAAARQRIAGDSWVWGRRGTDTDLSPLVAMTLAYWGSQRSIDPVANVF